MSEPIILYFDYRERGQEETREIELEVISPEFYDNGKKALKIYSNILDISDKWQNKSRFQSYKLLKEAGFNPTHEFFDSLSVEIVEGKEYSEEQLKILKATIEVRNEVEYIMSTAPNYYSQRYFEIYEYLVENLFMYVFKDLKIDWTNPSIPFLDIAKAYYSVWQNVFFGSVRDTKRISTKEKKEENENLDAKTPTNTPSENETSQPDQKMSSDSLPELKTEIQNQTQPVEATASIPESLTP